MASSAALELIIGVTDKASGPLKSIAGGLGTLGKIGGTALLGGAVAGVGALSAALVTGIGDAREANIIMAQTEAVIKSTGGAAGVTAGHIADLSGELSAASGKSLFGDSQIQESANLLLTFTNLKGGVLDAATAMSVDLAQAMGGAPADAAVQLGKALNDPINGVSALSRVGVTFTDTQKAMIEAMVGAGNTAGAQQVILAELNKEFGGSAAAAAAADGGFTQFKDRMGELAESIGAQVLPLLNQFMAWLNSPEIQAAITNIGTNLVAAVTAAAAGFQTFMATMQPVVGFVQDNLTAILAALAAMLITVVVPAFVTWATAAGAAAVATIAALAPVLLPIAAIGAAVGLLVTAWNRDWGGMRTTITAWWTGSVQPVFETVKTWLMVNVPAAITALKSAWDTGFAAIRGFIEALKTTWDTAVAGINTAINLAKDYIGGFRDTVSDKIDEVVTFFTELPGKITTAIGDLSSLLVSAGSDLVAGLKAGIASAWGKFTGWIQDQINKIPKVVRDALGIHSPSRVMIPLGEGIVEGLQVGINNLMPKLETTLTGGLRDILNGAAGAIDHDGAAAVAALERMVASWNAAVGRIQAPSFPGGSFFTLGGGGDDSRYTVPAGPSFPLRYAPAQSDDGSYNAKSGGNVTYIDARGASDPRGIEAAVDRAMRAAGVRTDLRLRTT